MNLDYRFPCAATLCSWLCFALPCLVAPSATAQPLDPDAFTSLGTLNLSGGNYTIDTDALTIFDNAAPGVALFTGVADNQGGAADYLNGVWVPGSMGIPEIAVFAFDVIDLAPTANVTITGTRAIALLSQGNATIGTPLSVDGSPGVQNSFAGNTPGSLGGPGGFAGGGINVPSPGAKVGEGPGGGNSAPQGSSQHSGGGFGGLSRIGTSFGLRYGDLAGHLQGGSGGGANIDGTASLGPVGAGGGGAIELGANGVLTINADISASGGNGAGGVARATGGSGGGIRVDAAEQVVLNARLIASGGDRDGGFFGADDGGGGRIFAGGLLGEQYWFVVGQPNALGLSFDDFPDLDVTPGSTADFATRQPPTEFSSGAHVEHFGVITLRPGLTIVPTGETANFGQAVDVSGPAINLTILPGDVRILSGGTFDIGAGAATSSDVAYELAALDARITGTGTLAHAGTLSGTGRVEVAYDNLSGAEVNAIGDELTFTHAVTNQVGGQVNAINSTLSFDAGLSNTGDINLINTTVNGDLINNGSVVLAGTSNFTGTVSGSGGFTGPGTAVFSGTLAPGNSPGTLTFEGDLVLETSATLEIEIGGTTPGVEFDQLVIDGQATLDGLLDAALLGDYMPGVGQQFAILTAGNIVDNGLALTAAAASQFSLLVNETSVILQSLAMGLDGDYNNDGIVDAADYVVWRKAPNNFGGDPEGYTTWRANFAASVGVGSGASANAAVPEPATLALLIFAAAGWCLQRGPATSRVPISSQRERLAKRYRF